MWTPYWRRWAFILIQHEDVMKWKHVPNYRSFVSEATSQQWILHIKNQKCLDVLMFCCYFEEADKPTVWFWAISGDMVFMSRHHNRLLSISNELWNDVCSMSRKIESGFVCVPNILLWSILCKTVGLPSSTGESERTARRQFHSPTLRCFRGRLCEVAAGRGPLKQSRWPESNWTLPFAKCGGGPVIRQILTGFYGTQAEIRPKTAHHFKWLRW